MPELKEQPRGIKKMDLVIVGVVILVAIVTAIVSQVLSNRTSGSLPNGPYVVIQAPTGVVYSEPLANNADVPVETKLGKNVIKVQDGIVWMDYSNCENQICVNTGKVHNIGDMIVCLPHQVLVQIVKNPADAALMNITEAADKEAATK